MSACKDDVWPVVGFVRSAAEKPTVFIFQLRHEHDSYEHKGYDPLHLTPHGRFLPYPFQFTIQNPSSTLTAYSPLN